jgi:hypothetical protein
VFARRHSRHGLTSGIIGSVWVLRRYVVRNTPENSHNETYAPRRQFNSAKELSDTASDSGRRADGGGADVDGPGLEGSQKSLLYRRFCRRNDLREQSGGASRAPSLREPGLIGFGDEFESAGSSP